MADRPRSAARLNAFDPKTTPTPTLPCPRAIAVIDDVISGPSAASAASNPSIASVRPRRSPMRSRRVTSSALAPRLSAAARAKTTTTRFLYCPLRAITWMSIMEVSWIVRCTNEPRIGKLLQGLVEALLGLRRGDGDQLVAWGQDGLGL